MKFKKRLIPVATEIASLQGVGNSWDCYDQNGRCCTIGVDMFNYLPEDVVDISWDSLQEMLLAHGFSSWTAECMYEQLCGDYHPHGYCCELVTGHDDAHQNKDRRWVKEPEFKTYQLKCGERYENMGAYTNNDQVIFKNGDAGLWQSPLCAMRDLPMVIGAVDWDGACYQADKKIPWIPLWVVKRLYVECDGPAKIEPTKDNYGPTWADLAKYNREKQRVDSSGANLTTDALRETIKKLQYQTAGISVNPDVVKKFSMMVDGKMKEIPIKQSDSSDQFPTPEELNDQRPASGVAREVAKAIELGKAYGAWTNTIQEKAAEIYRDHGSGRKPKEPEIRDARHDWVAYDELANPSKTSIKKVWGWPSARDKERDGVSNVAKAQEFKFHRGTRITYSEES